MIFSGYTAAIETSLCYSQVTLLNSFKITYDKTNMLQQHTCSLLGNESSPTFLVYDLLVHYSP